jgi:SAM-dependent methyltransferase
MPRSSIVRPYRWLAVYYDRLFASFRRPINTARQHVLGRILPTVKSACDLACGTGETALTLARLGIKTFAADLSPMMCRVVDEKARRASLQVCVIQTDMRHFRLPQRVDLITCEFDALNHVPRKTDLRVVANAVARALNAGGYFLFDVNNRKGFKQYWSSTYWIEEPGVAVVMRNAQDFRHDKAWCDIEWFVREGKLWRRRSERVEEVCWTSPEIRHTLRVAGFDRLRTWDAAPFFTGNPLVRPGCRTVYLARKAFS